MKVTLNKKRQVTLNVWLFRVYLVICYLVIRQVRPVNVWNDLVLWFFYVVLTANHPHFGAPAQARQGSMTSWPGALQEIISDEHPGVEL